MKFIILYFYVLNEKFGEGSNRMLKKTNWFIFITFGYDQLKKRLIWCQTVAFNPTISHDLKLHFTVLILQEF